MATTIEQQVALDEALVLGNKRLRIGRSNFRLPSDIQSKESTLQVVYDVLRISPFFKAFLVTADVPEIYMQEFWATAYVHQNSIRFKMNTRKNIVDLEAFREMFHIIPRVEHNNQKKSNEMYYPRFTKVIIHHFMTKEPSIPRRNKVNWHYVRDDILFSTIKVVSRHQNTQQYDAILPIELTTEDIRNTKAYKEYYACATGEAAPKPKASARKRRGGSDSSTTPPTVQGGSSIDEGTGSKPEVPDVPSDDSEEEISWNSSDDEDVDDQDKGRDDNEGEKTDESDANDDDQDETEKDEDDDDDDEEEIAKIDE
nr:hypothetical protein [Tanacetum cinerariifolium]